MHRSASTALLLALAISASTLVACGHCRDACRTYEVDRAQWAGSGHRPDDPTPHLSVSLTQDLVRRAGTQFTAALGEALQRRFPVFELGGLGRLTTHADLILDELTFLDSPNGAAARLTIRLHLYTTVRSVMVFRAGVEGSATMDVALRPVTSDRATALALHGGESELVNLALVPTGLMGMGSSPETVARRLDQGILEAFEEGLLRTLADIEFVTIRDLRVGTTDVALFVSGMRTEARGERLRIDLQTDLPVADVLPPPDPSEADQASDIAVSLSPSLAGPMLAAALSSGEGAHFDDEGRPDPDGDYAFLVQSLTPGADGVAFSYRAYRFSRPCLVADFEGTGRIAMQDGAPSVTIDQNELVSATRYESQVRERQPPVGRMSRQLTEMLGGALIMESVSPAPGLSLDLVPATLRIDGRGFLVGWRAD